MSFVRFMSTPAGRSVRVAIGVALLVAAIAIGPPVGWALGAFALLPLVTGAADICPVGPLLGEGKQREAGCRGASCS